jgi:acyl transferase domain-containing protein/NADPH:quinone reductase-like Zn-dependent oxidoreductase/NADP-dependent 3-hydroxy acid dehydrogenase YdfG/acyl carrier protein
MSAVKLALTTSKMRSEVAGIDYLASEPVAIVGLGCRFPGGANSPEGFWKMLAGGVDAIREVPPERWDVDAFYDPDPAAPGKIGTRWGGFLESIDTFDAEFFGIAPREAATMDPQQRLLLEVAWEALADAGYPSGRLAGSLTGVYLALYNNDYAQLLYRDTASIDAHTSSGTAHSIGSGRIAYLLDLKGPCLTVDTACSSSLVAVHLGVQALRQRECRMALAGGVSLVLSPEQTISLSKWGMLAPDGRCKTFDARANGFIRGEGCGVVVLKRLGDALEEGDRILAVIRGSAVNHDGRSSVLTAPNGLSQEAVIRQALRNACVDAASISYIEAHGTGTALGDPIEVEALKNVVGAPRPDGGRCLLGSVKTNIGHLEAAAGIAGLIKVVLSMQHGEIPPHLHFVKLNPMMSLDGTCLAIAPGGSPWTSGDAPRLAGVSSFGFGGTNAHLVIEEPPRLPSPRAETAGPLLLTVSARTAEGLQRAAGSLRAHLASPEGRRQRLRDICYTASVLRSHHRCRLALTAATHEAMAAKLTTPPTTDGAPEHRRKPRIGFIFSGQGSHWTGMGRELLAHDELFREKMAQCDEWLRREAGWSAVAVLTDERQSALLERTAIQQPVLFAIQVALAARWQAWGLRPAAVVGHSVGEVAAAHVSGALTLEQALAVVMHRGRLMQGGAGKGMMASVAVTAAEARKWIAEYEGRIVIAALNAPEAVTLSGATEEMRTLLPKLAAAGCHHKVLPVDCAFHSSHMAPYQDQLAAALEGLTPRAGGIPMFSTVTGGAVQGPELDPAHWGRNLRQPVVFAQAVAAMAAGCDIFLEIGPHPVLLPFVAQILAARGQGGQLIASLRRGRPERETLLEAAAALYASGSDLQWSAFFRPKGRCVALPAYPWQRERFWAKPAPGTAALAPAPAGQASGHPLLGARLPSPLIDGRAYQSIIGVRQAPFLSDHRVLGQCVVPGAAMLDMAMAAALDAADPEAPPSDASPHRQLPCRISDLAIQEALVLDDGARRLQFGLAPKIHGEAAFQLFSAPADARHWVRHASGRIRWGAEEDTAAHAPWPASLEAARAACAVRQDVARHYADMALRGLEFGPAFRGIVELYTGEGTALARLAPPDQSATGRDGHVVHPAFLDAWLQVLGALLPATGPGDPAAPVYLPVALERLDLFKIPAGPVWSCGRLQPGGAPGGHLEGAIGVFDDDGARIARISGLRLAAVPRETLQATLGRPRDEFLYTIDWQPRPLAPGGNDAGSRIGQWIVLGDGGGVAEALTQRLGAQGATCVQVSAGDGFARRDAAHFCVAPSRQEDFRRLFDALAPAAPGKPFGLVHLFGLDAGRVSPDAAAPVSATQALACGSVLHLVQALARSPLQGLARLWLVTRGARPADGGDQLDAFQAPLWGLGTVIALEHPELSCTRIDLDPAGRDEANAALLAAEVLAESRAEAEVAFRQGARRVPRLAPWRDTPPPPTRDTSPALVLPPPANGVIDDLAFAPAERRPPGHGEIEIAVAAVGLNFRDVLNALKMLPGTPKPLGGECAGRVAAVGPGVAGLGVGDAVLAFALDAFRSHVTVNQAYVAAKPPAMSYPEAASLPVVFLTAHYALRHLATIGAGDTILIHAAAGGVGLAAVQIARAAGAEIFATAGSPAKRDYLRSLGLRHVMDSRSTAFADQILEQTHGRGVDFVLNSLSGDMIPKSLSVVRTGGTFFEIGKRGIWEADRVERLRPGTLYHVFDLATVANDQPALIRRMLDELMQRFAAGELAPLRHTLFPHAQVAEAFRTMARARHMGKIVVGMPALYGGNGPETALHQEATYLITGGLGALGGHTARWLIQQGARHIALAGRRPPGAATGAHIAALQQLGAEVQVFQADLAEPAHAARLLEEIAERMPPLRGIVHAAGVLDDGALLSMDWQRFQRVLAPKMDGAWHLHRLTRGMSLDFFIAYSSAAAVIGWPGQGNYAAANAFLDALAHQRRHAGLPGLSINWGPWSEAGMAAELADARRRNFAAMGFEALSPTRGMVALARMVHGGGQIVALPVDWPRFRHNWRPGINQAFFEAFGKPQREAPRHTPAIAADDLRARLEREPAGNRRALLMAQLERKAAQVLDLAPGRRIEPLRPLKELGLDSLMAVELRNALNLMLACPLPATLLFDYPSLDALAHYLAEKVLALDMGAAQGEPPAAPVVHGTAASALAAVSEQEAEAMLLAELQDLETTPDE